MAGEAEYLGTAEDATPTFGGGTAGPYWSRTYVWGEDLSGSLQGAGGVGGLLLINRHERGSKPLRTSWATSDLNGNVIGLVENNLKAVYEYDPFGKPLRVSEPEENLNPFRFSTKYTDAETGLCYYRFRYCSPELGRWLSRDPIEESGGVNLYGMVENDPVNRWDLLGMACGKNLTKGEAKALACAIEAWLVDAAVGNALILWGDDDESLTLKFLRNFMSKSGETMTVPSDLLLKDKGIAKANEDARAHFSRGGRHHSTNNHS